MVAEYLFKKVSKIPTEVFLASEFRYREEVFVPDTLVIAISQSGETADTIAAIKKCHDNNLTVIGVVNVVGSTISRITDSGVYNHAGPEIGVASTKAFISQLSVLTLISIYLAKIQNKSFDKNLILELNNIGEKMDAILKEENILKIKSFAEKYSNKKDFLYLGRGFNYPVALEGALKLKEISYIHAEGYAGGEMKHGPLAMIDENFPTFAIATKNKKDNLIQDKLFSNLEEIKARKGEILCIATEGDENINHITNDLIYIPETLEELEPLLVIIPMQLFAYYVGKAKNLDVDKPRNLAKSVTVE